MNPSWERRELAVLLLYALAFYVFILSRSLQLSRDHYRRLFGLRPGWLLHRLNDVSDAQWRNFRGNLPILTVVFGIFTLLANTLRTLFRLKARGMSIVWLLLSLTYLSYLHGVCIIFIISIASVNFLLVKILVETKYFSTVLWIFNIAVLICNRVYDGYSFSFIGQRWSYLDNFRGTFRWHICFNFVILRMISFGYDYAWSHQDSQFDQKKHIQRCHFCKSGKTCYQLLQLDMRQNSYSIREVAFYGLRWMFSLFLMELMTHFLYYNAFAISGTWKQLSPMDVFIIGYGVLNFMWLKFLLIWRYFRFWSLISGVEASENMPKCINNCYNLEGFWKNWHASFNRWLVRYMYIPLGGSQRKLLNVWVIFSFVAIWHDLEWKLLSWAWLTCIFFIPEMILKSVMNAFQAESAFGQFVFRELSAAAGAITITCLMVANLIGYVIGPSGINWLISRFLHKEGLPTLAFMIMSFYVGTKIMFQIRDAKQRK
ncbi:membrane-bound O-acyltransferase gup1 isoform X7 [Malania oleifera]|uniref:membrane-bound O-acyltransferase gup1 isoform X7 n=1 Tax=Malania oleifera TaxID=397392 RepID=UPI0025AEA292|nr:membrane-bound O-acyltransferase gup1 isoform X7 [Malania oleifera]